MKTLTKKALRKKRAFTSLQIIFGGLTLGAAVILVASTLGEPVDHVFEVLLGCSILFAVLAYIFYRQVQSSISVGDYDTQQVVLRLRPISSLRSHQEYPERLVQFVDIIALGASHMRPQVRFSDGNSGSATGWWPTLYFQTKNNEVYTMPLYGQHRHRAQQLLSHGLSPYRDRIEVHTSVAHILKEEKLSVALELPQPTVHDEYPTKAKVAKRTKIHLLLGYGILGLLVLILVLGIAFPDSEPIQAVFQQVLRFFEWLGEVGDMM